MTSPPRKILRRTFTGFFALLVCAANVASAQVTTTVTFLQRGGDRFFGVSSFDDPRYQPNSPCASMLKPSGWVRTPFAEVQGTWYRANTGDDTYSDIRGAIFQGGLAAQRRAHNGSSRVSFGAFIDSGDGNYDTFNRVEDVSVRANGNIEYLGGGAFFRKEWNNGLRFDTMFRGGHVKNKFFSPDLGGTPVHYRMENAYWGTNIGLGYTQQLSRSTLDIYSRYSWLMVEGGKMTDAVKFDALHSHRFTTGARWTVRRSSVLSWYVGAAYEQEFNGVSYATEEQTGLVFDHSTLLGGTAIGEVGLKIRPCDRLQLTAGLEGYNGKRDGGSAFVSAMWKW